MEEVNPEFEQADVALIIGANDVVNRRRAPIRAARFSACPF